MLKHLKTLFRPARAAGPSATPKLARKLLSESEVPAKRIRLEETRAIIDKSKKIWRPIVWVDCEMTGLDVQNDHIIEICCIITDGNLKIVDEAGYESTVYVPKKVLDNMNEWCVEHHTESGLVAKILANPQQTLEKVQGELLAYITKYIDEPRKGVLAGNSVHMDKFFMMKEFPKVIEHLHYRLIDVSSIMEMGWRHNPDLMRCFPKKKGAHTAKSDILESIAQLRWYKENYLKSPKETEEFVARHREEREEERAEADTVSKQEPKKESKQEPEQEPKREPKQEPTQEERKEKSKD